MADKEMMIKPVSGGWLLVRLDTGKEASLPEYCHVKLKETVSGRDVITIQEGPYAQQRASVKHGFLVERRQDGKAIVLFYVASNVLSWQGGPAAKFTDDGVSGGTPVFTSASNPVPFGNWNVEIPDFPHGLGRGYTGYAGHAMTWFRVATPDSKDRYIHCGTISEGCVTVGIKGDKTSANGQAALRNYERLYAYLIARRDASGIVGQIQVYDH